MIHISTPLHWRQKWDHMAEKEGSPRGVSGSRVMTEDSLWRVIRYSVRTEHIGHRHSVNDYLQQKTMHSPSVWATVVKIFAAC